MEKKKLNRKSKDTLQLKCKRIEKVTFFPFNFLNHWNLFEGEPDGNFFQDKAFHARKNVPIPPKIFLLCNWSKQYKYMNCGIKKCGDKEGHQYMAVSIWELHNYDLNAYGVDLIKNITNTITIKSTEKAKQKRKKEKTLMDQYVIKGTYNRGLLKIRNTRRMTFIEGCFIRRSMQLEFIAISSVRFSLRVKLGDILSRLW